jgi:SAM-dependent methyltransferase
VSTHTETAAPRQDPDTWEAGNAYEAYMGRWSRLVAASFIEWLSIAPGGVWLDVGCGTGALTAAICEVADPLAVTGVDQSRRFVAHAADLSCVDKADFAVADAAALPFADGIFDVAVSGLVLNFLPDPVTALLEQSRVVAPSGTVAAFVWDYAEGMRLLRLFWDVARRQAPVAAVLDERVRFPEATPKGLVRLFERAGLEPLATTALEVECGFRDFDELWAPFLSGHGPAPGYVAGLDDVERASLRDAFAHALPTGADGSIHLSARAWAIQART